MNTTQLECFLAVGNYLNFSRAAEQLRITQPAVSHQISVLEDELGVKLFHRTSKSVRLTPEGYLFSQYAGEILKLTDLSKIRVKESREGSPTRLSVGCRNTTELRFICPALEELRRENDRLLPILRLIPFDSLENLLDEGDIQIMFSFQGSAPKKARYRELLRCPVACICAPGDPLARSEALTVARLREAGRVAACRPPICSSDLYAVQSLVVGGRPPDQVLFCDNQEIMSALVTTGYAFGITADLPHARLPGLRYIPIPELPLLSFGAVYLPGERSPALHRFLELLTASLPEGS